MRTPLCGSMLSCVLVTLSLNADVLELKNGTVLNGKYIGGTSDVINFESSAGMQAVSISQAVALTFTARTPAAAAPSATPSAAEPAPSTVSIPAGTGLLVRLLDPLSSQTPAGTKFATRLEQDLVVGTTVAVKAGTTIYGVVESSAQARRAAGQSTLEIRLTQIATGGNPIAITTGGYKQGGERSGRKAARGAAAGATIGAIAGDAGTGAAIGATAGALKRGESITIPPGSLLDFSLTQAVTIKG